MIRLALRVRRADAEVALAELLELAPGGVEEVDLGDRVEYAVYGAAGELPALPDLEAAVGGALVEVVTTEVADDWDERWREFHQPIDVAPLHVRAPWHPAPAAGDALDLVIDPGQAFGTGAHHTTRLCLELLTALAAREDRVPTPVMDVGCGSGVLAIAAAKLGFTPVLGLDHEVASVAATGENAERNGVELRVFRHDLMRQPVPGAPLLLANLLRPLLMRLARDGVAPGSPRPRIIIASGLLAEEADEVGAALAAAFDLQETDRRHGGEWAALLLEER